VRRGRSLLGAEPQEPLLEASDLGKLLDTLNRIEDLFAWPPDIEWTGRSAAMVLLQARPITTAKPDGEDERAWYLSLRPGVRRLPVMICPRWVSTPAQPIAVEDVLECLLAALDWDEGESRVFEIGGPDQVSYGDIMREYARQRGLRRLMISVPVLTPHLSSLWLGLVTPVYARVGRKLIEGVRNPTLVRDPAALHAFAVRPRGLADAIRLTCESVMLSTSGASKRSSPSDGSVLPQRCASQDERGWSLRSRNIKASRRSGRRRSSILSDCGAWHTGTRFTHCIKWCSLEC
jgi:hypothetical protein